MSAKDRLTVDLSAGAQVASNPFLQPNAEAGVGGEAGVAALYRLERERTTLDLGAAAQTTTYSGGHGTDLSGNASANLAHRVSSRLAVQLLGHYRYSRSSGQDYLLSSGVTSPRQTDSDTTPGVQAPIITVPQTGAGGGFTLPPDATLVGRRVQEHAWGAGANAEVQLNTRSTLSLTADVNVLRYTDNQLSDYKMFSEAAAFSRQVSENTRIVLQMKASQVRYTNGEHDDILSPTVGVNRKLSAHFDLGVYGGASIVHSRLPDGTRIRSTTLSATAEFCGHYGLRNFCISGQRQELPSALGGVRPTTTVRATFSDRLNQKDTLNLGLAFDRRGRDTRRLFASETTAGGTARYDHRFGDRLSGFVSAEYVRLWESGQSSRSDIRGSVGITLRLGDRG